MTATTLTDVSVGRAPIEQFRELLDEPTWAEFEQTMHRLAAALRGRIVWNVNSTAQGGGVAELLGSLIPYDRDVGIDERWVVIAGSPPFFAVTKRLHNLLHGSSDGDDDITPEERRVYDETLALNVHGLLATVRPGDIVVVHDPQAAGLVPPLAQHGAPPAWRSHAGVDAPNDAARTAWRMLGPYLGDAAALVFSRRAYVWEGLDETRVHVIAPTIDPFSVKNRDIDAGTATSILKRAGIVSGADGKAWFRGADGEMHAIEHEAVLCGPAMPDGARAVVQVSRWDELKDPVGVMRGFIDHVAPRVEDSRLILAGPGARSVRDDPEQPAVLRELTAMHERLEPPVRERVIIAQLPMDDVDENAVIVNALQHQADVVVQKSLAEGFGLTVAEAMWKGRPIVASRVGGIADQIEHGRSGLLIDDPTDLRALGDRVVEVLVDPSLAERLGSEARRRAIRHYLAPRHLVEQARLVLHVLHV